MKKILINVALTAIFAPIIWPEEAQGFLTPVHEPEIHSYTPALCRINQSDNRKVELDDSLRGLLTQDCQPLTPCQQVYDLMSSFSQSINSWCKQLNDEFNQALSLVDECSHVIPITEPGTISQPGLYCLNNDLLINDSAHATLTIAADNVILNLNGHSIANTNGTALFINKQKNITITNGSIVDCQGVSSAFLCLNSSNVEVSYLTIAGNSSRIRFSFCSTLSFHHCLIHKNTGQLLAIDNSNQGTLKNNRIIDNKIQVPITTNSIDIVKSNNIDFINHLIANNTTSSGIFMAYLLSSNCACSKNIFDNNASITLILTSNVECNNITIENCVFSKNTATTTFLSAADKNAKVLNCIGLNNNVQNTDYSFGLPPNNFSVNPLILNCVSLNCKARGFWLRAPDNAILKNNIAISCSSFGFRAETTAVNTVFEGNYAAGNSTNYSGTPLPYIIYDLSSGSFKNPNNTCTVVNPLTQDNISVEQSCVLP